MSALPEDAYHALHKQQGLPIPAEVKAQVSVALDASNPLLTLSHDAFVALLGLVAASNQVVHGRAKTKTTIQMRRGLEVLQGTRDVRPLDLSDEALWTWEDMAGLNMEPLVAFAYKRMVQELRALQQNAKG